MESEGGHSEGSMLSHESARVQGPWHTGHGLGQVDDDLGLGCLGLDPLHELGTREGQDEISRVRVHLEDIPLIPVSGHAAVGGVVADSHARSLCIPCALGSTT